MKKMSVFMVALGIAFGCCTSVTHAIDNDKNLTNREFIEYVADEFDVNYSGIMQEEYIREYYTKLVSDVRITRADALVGLMRLYHLIPDFDTIELYAWKDIPANSYTDVELAYISYAKELGITNGVTDDTFGFSRYTSIAWLNIITQRIENLNNLNDLQVDSIITVYDDEETNCNVFVEPLLIEVLMQMPDSIYESLKNSAWSIRLIHEPYFVVNTTKALGATYNTYCRMDIATKTNTSLSVYITMVHELAHAIEHSCGWEFDTENSLDAQILNEEMPKLANLYRTYASKSNHEYIACVFEYVSIYGIDKFEENYPLTYEWINLQLV